MLLVFQHNLKNEGKSVKYAKYLFLSPSSILPFIKVLVLFFFFFFLLETHFCKFMITETFVRKNRPTVVAALAAHPRAF